MKLTRRFFFIFRRILVGVGVLGTGMILGSLLLAFFLAGEIYDYQDTFDGTRLPDVDAIVCLAGGRGRITAAGDLWYRYWEAAQAHPNASSAPKVPLLYFAGMGQQATWANLSRQLRRGVLEKIRPTDLLIERESFNTDANARWFARHAHKAQWKRILLLTSSYHMKRSQLIFQEVLNHFSTPIEVHTHSVFQEPFSTEEWRSDPNGIRVTVLEYLKWIYYQHIWKKME